MRIRSNTKTRRAIVRILLFCALWLTHTESGHSQVTTSITPTQPPPCCQQPPLPNLSLGTNVAQDGNTWTITGGTQAGQNLFHSFNTFNVGTGTTAQFQNTPIPGALLINNIFARVIGGQASQIDGTIQTSGFGAANLWFMNPSGILFGPNASLNIGGSANFTTASSLGFGPQGSFDIGSTRASLGDQGLSVVNLSEFGFLRGAGRIEINESVLKVSPNQTLAFVGNGITVTGGTLQAPSGAIRITSANIIGDPRGDAVLRDPQTGEHVYDSGDSADRLPPTLPGPLTVGQSIGGKDAMIDTGSTGTIQLNTVTYAGTSATGFNPITIPGDPPFTTTPTILIANGSILVANLPKTQLIVSAPAVTSLTPDTSLDIGATGNLTATLNHAFTSPVGVQLRSDNTSVASVAPASVTIPAGQNSAPVQFQGIAPGNTAVRATVGNTTAAAAIQVGFPESQLTPTPSALIEGNSGTATVTLVRPISQPVTVTFASSNPAVLSAPAPQEIAPNQRIASAPFSTFQSGSATLTASFQVGRQPVGTTTSGPIQVNPVAVTTLAPDQSIPEGSTGNLIVTLAQSPPHPITVTFTSSDPTVVRPPSPVTIQPNQQSPQARVPIQGTNDGVALITAFYAGDTASAVVQVTPPNATGPGALPDGDPRADFPVNNGSSTQPLTDPTTVLTTIVPSPSQLVLASGRCASGTTGEFSSFVRRGRDASPLLPGGLLASPLIVEEETPSVGSLSIQPGILSFSTVDPLKLAPGTASFLTKYGGC